MFGTTYYVDRCVRHLPQGIYQRFIITMFIFPCKYEWNKKYVGGWMHWCCLGEAMLLFSHSKHTLEHGLLLLIFDVLSRICATRSYLLPSPQWRLWTDAFLSGLLFRLDCMTTLKCFCCEITHRHCRQNILVIPSPLRNSCKLKTRSTLSRFIFAVICVANNVAL